MNVKSTVLTLFFVTSLFSTPKIKYLTTDSTWEETNSVALLQGDSLLISTTVDSSEIISIKWYQIIPDISHYYNNANFPDEPNPYAWKGFDTIDYAKVELPSYENQTVLKVNQKLLKKTRPLSHFYYQYEVGSFWFQAEITLVDSSVVSTVGLEQNDHRGISPDLFRVSYMMDSTYLGYLTTFFNVPGIFGSIPYQNENYIGVDCADVLISAKAIRDGESVPVINVAMMVEQFDETASFMLVDGEFSEELRWGEEFNVGDFIAVRYSPTAQFAHIGVLYRDHNENGLLDSDDLVLHAGPHALHLSYLKSGGFDGYVKLLTNE